MVCLLNLHIVSAYVRILSCPRALLEFSFLIIILFCATLKSVEVKTELVWVVNLVHNKIWQGACNVLQNMN